MILPATTATSFSESDHSSYLSKRFSTGSTANSKFIVLGAMLGSIVGFLTVYYILLEIAMPLCKLCELKTDKSCEHTFINRQFDEVVEETLSRPHSQMNTSNINSTAHSSSAGPNNSQQQEHKELTPVVPVAKINQNILMIWFLHIRKLLQKNNIWEVLILMENFIQRKIQIH